MQGLKKKKEIKRRSEVQKKLAEVHGNRNHKMKSNILNCKVKYKT